MKITEDNYLSLVIFYLEQLKDLYEDHTEHDNVLMLINNDEIKEINKLITFLNKTN